MEIISIIFINLWTTTLKPSFQFTDVSGTYTCDLCGIKFSVKATFELHKKSHSKDTEPSVGVSSVADDLAENTSVEQKNQIFDPSRKSSRCQDISCKADGCGITFTTQKQLKKHMIIHKLATYNCLKCKKVYHSKNVYETHVRLCMPRCEDVVLIADEDIDSGPVECSTCCQLFENKRVLKIHQRICNDGNDENGSDCMFNEEIEEIYLKTEVEDELENLVPSF